MEKTTYVYSNAFRRGLAVFFAAAAIFGFVCATCTRAENSLADKMVRLHVIANSDSDEDQALKLKVRDEILTTVTDLCASAETSDEALEIISEKQELISSKASEAIVREGYDYPVDIEVGDAWFPTKYYDGFALPAGEYTALRVIIGEGEGHNWWCVLFPPLCTCSEAVDAAREAGLDDNEISLITSDGAYELRFRLFDLISKLRMYFMGE